MSILRGLHLFATAIAETMTSVSEQIADNMNNYTPDTKDNDLIEQRTYNYWKGLSCNEQQEYFANSRTCQKYGENYRYDNHELMAKSAARIAGMERYALDNKYIHY